MNLSDAITAPHVPLHVKLALVELAHAEAANQGDLPILTPTARNDDINGSQHATGGGTNFTYEVAEVADLEDAATLGFYEYFSDYFGGVTGHYYQGDGNHYAALVVNPPAYAVSVML